MQGGGELPWEVTCRGVVDRIAMVIHMTRREGRRVVEEAPVRQGLRCEGKPMGHSAGLASCYPLGACRTFGVSPVFSTMSLFLARNGEHSLYE